MVLWLPLGYSYYIENKFVKIPVEIDSIGIGPGIGSDFTIMVSFRYILKGIEYNSTNFSPVIWSGTDTRGMKNRIKKDSLHRGPNWGYVNPNNQSQSYLRIIYPGFLQWFGAIVCHVIFIVLIILRMRLF